MSAVIVIPARMASTRFPNKPLALIRGRSMIERIYAIGKATGIKTVIATDSEELKAFAETFGARVLITSSDCLTGTDRIAEASHVLSEYEIFLNLQGDAVLTPPWILQELLQEMQKNPSLQIATPATLLSGKARKDFIESKKQGSSTGTTVVFDKNRNALYFSKALIPFSRTEEAPIYRHIGLYAYRKQFLQNLSTLPEGPLEKGEKLEPLRALENGLAIRIVSVDYRGRTHASVDRPEDIQAVESLIASEGELLPLR